MIIRCPQCEHSRNVNEHKIPPTAELATCPKCKHRFRFRTVPEAASPDEPRLLRGPGPSGEQETRPLPPEHSWEDSVLRPQGAVRETAFLREKRQAGQERDEQATSYGGERFRSAAALEKASAAIMAGYKTPGARASGSARAPGSASAFPDLLAARDASRHPFPETLERADVPEAVQAAAPSTESAPDQPPRPEERVERDMRMLFATPKTRPTRDLGSLFENTDQRDQSPPEEAAFETIFGSPEDDFQEEQEPEDNAIPWENPAECGWFKGFMSTVHGVMFRGPDFFAHLPAHGSLSPGYLFFLILGYMTILSSIAWSQALAALLPDVAQVLAGRVALPVLLLLAPIALGLMLLFVTGCIRIILLAFAPEKSEFSLVYRLVSYSVAPFVLSVVPFVGPVVGALWFVASLITGCRNALKLSWKLSVFTPLPPAAMLLGGLVWYFL